MSIYNFATSPLAGASAAQGGVTEQSLKFDRASISYLSRTASSPTLGTKATWSFWIKKSDVSEVTSTSYRTVFYAGTPNSDGFRIGFARYSGNGHSLQINQDQGSSGAYMYKLTNAFYRDVAGWYHFVVSYDSTNATAADRIKIYANGELTSLRTSPNVNPSLNHIPAFQVSGKTLKIGDGFGGAYNEAIDAYLADVYFIDGQALDATSFGETVGGYWKKKDYTGSYGANGFKLNFRDDTVSEGFNAVTWKGNSPSSQSISGLGFSPDLVWIKSRSQTYNHVLADTVRGQGKDLYSNTTAAESSSSTELISFDADGFSVGSGGSANDPTGSLGFVAWCWDAGSGSPVSNTDGTITSTVKANPAYGFSIVSYTGTGALGTVGHGLSATPEFIIFKRRNSTSNWISYNSTSGSSNALYLDLTNGNTATTYMNSTDPTASVFTVNTNTDSNGSGGTYIAYCFNSVAGYSKIGSYTGTGATGNSINLGFKPAFLLIKETGNANSWELFDNTRNTSSPFDKRLFPNDLAAEATTTSLSYSDTGFETLNGNTGINRSGGTYIYYAVADTREAAFWKDVSGENSNNWTPNNLDYRDSVFDSPANNFATLNPLSTTAGTYTEGNTQYVGASGWRRSNSTMAVSSGKWYWEYCILNDPYSVRATNSAYNAAGFGVSTAFNSTVEHALVTDALVYTDSGYYKNFSGSYTSGAANALTSTGDIIGFAVDLDANTFTIYKNNVSEASGSIGMTAGTEITPILLSHSGPYGKMQINLGQDSTFAGAKAAGAYTDSKNIGSFAYQPPSGYLALCTANLPTPAITDGSTAFSTALFTGTGSTRSVTSLSYQPDFTWFKRRDGAVNHALYDVIRGDTNALRSNTTGAEAQFGDAVVTFQSDGFEIAGTNVSGINGSGESIASWNWKAGGTAVSNTDGSITSQVSANVDAGFSIVTYTGTRTSDAGETGTPTTIGHGLGKKPAVVITKAREVTTNARWNVWHQGYQPDQTYLNYQIWLNETSGSNNAGWQRTDTGFSTTTFCPARYSWDDVSGIDYVAYCFAEIEGYSKFGSYTGNSSADGSFVYTGFRPAWILIKSTSAGTDWMIYDNKRLGYNVDNNPQRNVAAVEQTDNDIDLLSNGFKFRRSSPNFNGATHIYLAFAEVPFKVANAR